MTGVEVLRLCRVLCQAGWGCTEAGVEFAEAWDAGHMQITAEVLHRALRPDEDKEQESVPDEPLPTTPFDEDTGAGDS